jgi:signal transduction histidine kinase/ligand-binding sensor domain-containing protein
MSLAGPSYAIDPNRAMSQYIHDQWGPEQGFPRGPVYAIAQSSDGYLWIGTQAGLVRFDGLNFRLLQDVPGLPNGAGVYGLTSDGHGNLWIRPQGKLVRYRNGAFAIPVSPMDFRISAMCDSSAGDLLISVMDQGVMAYRQGKFEMVADTGDLLRSPVLSIAQTPDGRIWSGTRDAGLSCADHGLAVPISVGLPDLKVNSLLAGAGGDLWVGTDSGIVRWNGRELVTVGPPSLHQLQILALEHDRDGNIWAGTDSGGLLRMNAQGTAYLDTGRRSHEAVTALFEDREGDLWIGRAGGIERLRDSAFVTYSRAEGLPGDRSNPVFVDSENRVWIPPVEGGLWWMKAGQRVRVSNLGLDNDEVYSIAGSKTELWLGRRLGGLTRLSARGDSFTARTYTTADGLAQNSVFSVYQARDGSVWAGTLSGGVSQLNNNRFTTYTSANGLLANTVASVVEASDGTMWFATTGGLSALVKGGWQGYTEKDGLPSNNVYCLLEDSKGVLWIGTAAGLAVRNDQGIQTPAMGPAWRGEAVLGLAEDKLGSLWIATSNHVLRMNREKLLRGILGEGDVRQFGAADGLRGAEGLRRHRSVMADAAGHIWFTLDRGISVVDPARLARDAVPAIAHVQTISADGSPVPVEGPVHIPGGDRRVTFGFAGLSLSVPELVRFRYRLDKYDSQWSEPTSVREAGYTNLAPGTYRFRVIASNPDGAWNGAEAAIAFQVDPLWWQTWWLRTCALIACGGVIFAYLRFRMQRLASRLNLQFEERLAERTRIARDLHDTLLQSFQGLMFRFQAARNMLPRRPDEAMQTLDRAIERTEQAIAEGRDAIHNLRASTSITNELAQSMTALGKEMSEDSQGSAAFHVVVEGSPRDLHPILRDEIYAIAREAVRNAFRHAQARDIEVEIRYNAGSFRLRVRDDGKGIDPAIAAEGRAGHYGVPGMRERAKRIGGKLDVWTETGAGMEVELRIPGSIAYGTSAGRTVLGLFRKKTENE